MWLRDSVDEAVVPVRGEQLDRWHQGRKKRRQQPDPQDPIPRFREHVREWKLGGQPGADDYLLYGARRMLIITS